MIPLENESQGLQPIYLDEEGRARFRVNKIVRFLWDTKKYSAEELRLMPFSEADWQQFNSLIGYSVTGFLEVSNPSERLENEIDAKVQELLLEAKEENESKS